MGVGLGYAIAAAAVEGSERIVFAIEGDSAFGFSGMEVGREGGREGGREESFGLCREGPHDDVGECFAVGWVS
jgi:hypothetical protein